MKNRLFLILFSLPFAGVGMGFIVLSIIPSLQEWRAMSAWQPVSARVLSADLTEHTSDDSTTYNVVAEYEYTVDGRILRSKRVAISEGADNIGDFHHRLARYLQNAKRDDVEIEVYVNPYDVTQSVINRDMRWGLFAFKSVFAVVFSLVGFGILTAGLKTSAVVKARNVLANTASDVSSESRPWLVYKDWSSPQIRSGAKTTMWVLWFIALVWNAVTLPATLQIGEEIAQGNYAILIVLLFNAIGIGIAVLAVVKTLEWRRFGIVVYHMDPYPGAIGGHVGGNIDIAQLHFAPGYQFKVTLTHAYSYVSGSGKNRNRSERVIWQDSTPGVVEPLSKGTRVRFRFDVPQGLHASELPEDDYHKWTLNVHGDVPGVDLNRQYDIPVFNTGGKSLHVSDDVVANKSSFHNDSLAGVVEITPKSDGVELYFPAGKNLGWAAATLVFGSVFFGVGMFLWVMGLKESGIGAITLLMAVVFTGVGLLIELLGVYSLGKSLWVKLTPQSAHTVLRVFGNPVFQRRVAREDIVDIAVRRESSGSVGSKTFVYYMIELLLRDRRKIRVAHGIKGIGDANQLSMQISDALGLDFLNKHSLDKS